MFIDIYKFNFIHNIFIVLFTKSELLDTSHRVPNIKNINA